MIGDHSSVTNVSVWGHGADLPVAGWPGADDPGTP